jgi:ABC-type branched-subunit amino acid transport system ATPase component
VKLMAGSAHSKSARTRTSMTKYAEIANQRFKSMHAMLNQQQKSVSLKAQQVRSVSQCLRVNSLLLALQEITRYFESS